MTATGWTLITRDDCGLCDDAIEQLAVARAPAFKSIWIDGDDRLELRYGTRVPVWRHDASGAELDWPFGADSVAAFIAACDGRG